MNEIFDIFTVVAQVLIICGGIMFVACFIVGAVLVWQMFTLSAYTYRLIHKWNNYKRIPVHGRAEADKSGKFPDDTENVK